MKRGRPPKGKNKRDAKVVICLETGLKEELQHLASDCRRSLSDYCHYVLEQHFAAVQEEELNGANEDTL